jgi:hypothetical protein
LTGRPRNCGRGPAQVWAATALLAGQLAWPAADSASGRAGMAGCKLARQTEEVEKNRCLLGTPFTPPGRAAGRQSDNGGQRQIFWEHHQKAQELQETCITITKACKRGKGEDRGARIGAATPRLRAGAGAGVGRHRPAGGSAGLASCRFGIRACRNGPAQVWAATECRREAQCTCLASSWSP